ncbi:MAG: DUF4062 domain-containing protein [Actinobacteria bacterium]|nr:DUF4062 domain-containing protein [Actinomycetota bacterium]
MALDRFFVGFVSSTFLDLQPERKAVAESLLRVKTFPLGMEYFPSTGGSQWSYIEESMAAADFFVFIAGGRYGSIDVATGLSWTHREYRAAQASGKPIIALLRRSLDTLPVAASDSDPAMAQRNSAFRVELESSQECAYFDTVAELEVALLQSIDHLKSGGVIQGWSKTHESTVVIDERSFDRVYLVSESHHRYSRSVTNPERLDLRFRGRRVVKSTTAQGLTHITIDFTKSSDQSAGFSPSRPVSLSLEHSRRDGPGSIRQAEPRKTLGATFVVDFKFDPPLRENETAEFEFEAFVPEYRFARASDLRESSRGEPEGERTFDFVSRKISHPTRELVQSVSFDKSLGVTILGQRSGPHGRLGYFDGGSISSSDTLVIGDDPTQDTALLRSTNPQIFWVYRLAWTLPD